MGYMVTTILLLIFIIVYRNRKCLVSPDSLFCILWIAITLLASMRLFGLYEASTLTWLIILIGSVSYITGTTIGYKIKNNYISNLNSDSKEFKPYIPKKLFWILIIILFINLLPRFLQSLEYMKLGYSLGEIREASYGMSSIQGFTRSIGIHEYTDLIISIIEMFVVASGISCFIYDMKKYKNMMLFIIIYEIIFSFTYGGRFSFAYMIIELITCFIIYKKLYNTTISDKITKKTKSIVKKMSVLLIIMIVVISLVRGAEVNLLLQKYYRYLCGNVVFLDLHIKDLANNNFLSFPFAGFYGFWNFILPIINKFGISYPQKYIDTINIIMDTQTFRHIGDKLSTNAFITPFYHPYADFRITGVIIGMFIFGIICGRIYKTVIIKKDNKSIINYLIISQIIFKTIQGYPFASKNYCLCLLLMYILNKRIIIKGKGN